MTITYEQITQNSHTHYVFQAMIAVNEYWCGGKYELCQVIDGYPLHVIAEAFFDGNNDVAFAFLQSDDAKVIAEKMKQEKESRDGN